MVERSITVLIIVSLKAFGTQVSFHFCFIQAGISIFRLLVVPTIVISAGQMSGVPNICCDGPVTVAGSALSHLALCHLVQGTECHQPAISLHPLDNGVVISAFGVAGLRGACIAVFGIPFLLVQGSISFSRSPIKKREEHWAVPYPTCWTSGVVNHYVPVPCLYFHCLGHLWITYPIKPTCVGDRTEESTSSTLLMLSFFYAGVRLLQKGQRLHAKSQGRAMNLKNFPC